MFFRLSYHSFSSGFLLLLFLLFPLLNACQPNTGKFLPLAAPAGLGDGLAVGDPVSADLDTLLLRNALSRIARGKYGEVHSLLLFRKGKLVLEQYFPGHNYQWEAPGHLGPWTDWDTEKIHSAHSVSKSVTSMLIGIALDLGMIESVDQSIFDYLPEYQYLKVDNKEYITIRHLLTCTSGLQWAEWSAPLSSRANDQVNIYFFEGGPVDYVLSRPFVAVPGSLFNYSGGGIELLGVILQNASGLDLQAFSDKYLFGPLGITSAEWVLRYPTGEFSGAGGLKARPRDLVKLGVLMLQDGLWEGKQVVSPEWVSLSREPNTPNGTIRVPGEDLPKMGYSHTWWTQEVHVGGKKVNWYSAIGWGGQKIIVLPELETVLVLTGANYTSKVKQFKLIRKYLFPAIVN